MIREFFYLQKSDRKVILTLLGVIVIAMGVIFFTGGEDETNGLMPVDTLRKEVHRDTGILKKEILSWLIISRSYTMVNIWC